MSPLVVGSSTIKRSLGERPVRRPVFTTRAPLAARWPSPRATARSISSAVLRLTCASGAAWDVVMSFPGPRGRFSLMCQAYLTPSHYIFDRVAGRSTIKRAPLWQKADQRGTATLPTFLVVLLHHRGRSRSMQRWGLIWRT